MYRRMVFLGLGGSGGKTLRFLKRDLRAWLTENGWPEHREIPAGYQFLHIDTPTVQDGRSTTGAPMLPDREYVGLVGQNVTFSDVATQLDNRVALREEFAGWRVDPAMVTVPITDGAGAYRAIGRTIAVAYMDQINSAVSSLADRAQSAESISELNELWALTHNGNHPTGSPSDPIVVVVSSLAGGTGAGLLLDVFDVLRSIRPTWGDKSFGILYTPEVFHAIGGKTMGGVQPNSLAAISELLNGYYWHGAVDGTVVGMDSNQIGAKEPRVLSDSGVIGSLPRTGPAYPFLVGSRNAANISFDTDKKVFETIGGALLAFCVDEVVQDQLLAFTMTNWRDKSATNLSDSDLLINRGSASEVALPAFNALGCARVSVGTRFLERYAAQRLAKDAASYVSGYHMNSDAAVAVQREHQTNQPAEIARILAEKNFTWFVRACSLEEKGPQTNQILDAIRPNQTSALMNSARSQALSQVDIGKNSAEAWIESIVGAVKQATHQYQVDYRPLLDEKVKTWVKEIQPLVLRTVEEAIGQFGLAVAVELIDQLVKYLADPLSGVAAELMGETEHGTYSYHSSESEWTNQVRSVLSGIRGNLTLQTGSKIEEGIDQGLQYSTYFAEAELREVISPLLNDFAIGFLQPLRRSLADEVISLERSITELSSWPDWSDGLPPTDCLPPDSEYTLIDASKFSQVFIDNLARTYANAEVEIDQKETHRLLVRTQVISGNFLREMEDYANKNKGDVRLIQSIQVSQPWNPGMLIVRDQNTPKTDLQIEARFTPEDFESRAAVWLRRPNTPFNDLLKSTLRSYTSGEGTFKGNVHVPETEYSDRRQQFLSQLTKAIQASAPLIAIDTALQSVIHEERPFRRQFSKLPFNGHPLEGDIINLIRPYVAADGDGQIAARYLVNDSAIESIQIISTLNGAHHPFLFESLLNPIAQRWSTVKVSPGAIQQFWSMRRARLLGEAIPAPQEHIIAMIRGWFTGRLLGLIDVPRNGDRRETRIAQPWSLEETPASFPYPFLTNPAQGHAGDELFAVLESLSLAFVGVSQANNLLPLRPYIVLRDMGSMLDNSNRVLAYETPNPLLECWIRNGNIRAQFATPNGQTREKEDSVIRKGLESALHDKFQAVVGASPEMRKEAVISLVNDVLKDYSTKGDTYWDKTTLNRGQLNSPPFWPSLRTTSSEPDLVRRALISLKLGVENLEIGSTTGV